ncbi:MAG: site-specific integrase [Deltaproteobacteria bacterium]|nr:MAG: site-specific integrase [Deltaproteobacteria bacterium]
MVARKLLELREGEIAKGKLPGIHFDKVTFDELAEDFIGDYEFNNRKSLERAQISADHLKGFFEGMRIADITTARIKAYIKTRQADNVANGTINRELSALKRMLRLGAQDTPPKVDRIPHIPMLKEDNIRKGFFEHEEYLSLLKALPSYLRGPVTFAYFTGWRKSEILGLTWDRVDLHEGTVRLEAGETKNSEARTVYLNDELLKLVKIQNLRRHGSKYVFHNNGKRIKDLRGAWKKACKEAKLEGKLFHDLRRTGVRNMVRAGIQEQVAMRISGHKTRTVFDRYNIVSPDDLQQAALKMAKFFETTAKTATIGQNRAEDENTGQAQVIEINR